METALMFCKDKGTVTGSAKFQSAAFPKQYQESSKGSCAGNETKKQRIKS